MLAESVTTAADQLPLAAEAGVSRAARLLRNVAMEEAGKFLALIDVYRAPGATQKTISSQFKRCNAHLPKLIYAQIADYSIASYSELSKLIQQLRQQFSLDGPMDFDFIVRNELLQRREGEMYVDLMDIEGELRWIGPVDVGPDHPFVNRSLELVRAIHRSGLTTPSGLQALSDAWSGFDPQKEHHFGSWHARNTAAVRAVAPLVGAPGADQWADAAGKAAWLWPMPLVEEDLSMAKVDPGELEDERERRYNAFLRREYGFDEPYGP